jgi:hypothetical protein
MYRRICGLFGRRPFRLRVVWLHELKVRVLRGYLQQHAETTDTPCEN